MWQQQKLIRNAELHVEVDDATAAVSAIKEVAKRHDGLVADAQVTASGGTRTSQILVRVPAEQLDEALDELRTLGTVEREALSTQDVTKEYFDLETRLGVKRRTAGRLQDLLEQQTGSLGDVIAAEAELGRVTEEIEQLEGEKRFYDSRVATSTIHIRITEAMGLLSGLWGPGGGTLKDSLHALGLSVRTMFLVLIVVIPWGILVWAGLFVYRRFSRGRSEPA